LTTEPEAISIWLEAVGVAIERLGLEAGPLSPWLSEGLQAAGLPAVCIETRRMKGATAAMAVKTDRNDAPAIAQAMRVGWFTAVHVKSVESLERRRAAVCSAERSAPARTVRISFGKALRLWRQARSPAFPGSRGINNLVRLGR
jgi:transposase